MLKENKVQGSDTFHFIYTKEVPNWKKVAYTWFCCDIRLQKDEINRSRLTVGGDQLDDNGKPSTKTAGLETIKIYLNRTILTEGTKYTAANIGNFYTN